MVAVIDSQWHITEQLKSGRQLKARLVTHADGVVIYYHPMGVDSGLRGDEARAAFAEISGSPAGKALQLTLLGGDDD